MKNDINTAVIAKAAIEWFTGNGVKVEVIPKTCLDAIHKAVNNATTQNIKINHQSGGVEFYNSVKE